MSFSLGKRSLANLKGVHPDLIRVVEEAIFVTEIDFVVTCGMRTLAEQEVLFKAGASRTMKSRHLTGHAIDLAPISPVDGKVSWAWPFFYHLNAAMKVAAKAVKVPLEWGGDCWLPDFQDGPHFQLPRKQYPK